MPGGISQGIIWGIMALGIYITFRLLDVADLTVDGSFTTGGAVTVMLILAGWPAWAALLAALLAGLLAGFVTGMLHTKLGIPAILAGILTQFSLYSINLHIMGMAANKAVSVDKYHLLLSSRNIPAAILTGLVIALALVSVMYWYFGTEQGSSIRATGNNPAMSRALGINIDNMKVLGLSLSNGIVALSGGLLAQYQGFADINMGRGAIVIGLAAVIIGEVVLPRYRHRPLAQAQLQRSQALHCDCCGAVPRRSVSARPEEELLCKAQEEGGLNRCWTYRTSPKPLTPAPSTRKRPSTV